jgi:hypothetical protein
MTGTRIPGAASLELEEIQHPLLGLAKTPAEWSPLFNDSLSVIKNFVSVRDGLEIVARSSSWWQDAAFKRREAILSGTFQKLELYEVIESAEIEVLQALTLMQAPKAIPTSPGNFVRLWSKLAVNIAAFSGMQPARFPDDQARETVVRKVRSQTIHYRNLFQKEDCETVVVDIFRRIEDSAKAELGFSLSGLFETLLALVVEIMQRDVSFSEHVRGIRKAETIETALGIIEFFCVASPTVRKLWSRCKSRGVDLESIRAIGFQLSELCHSWIYSLDLNALREKFGAETVSVLEKLAIRPGELRAANPLHFYMNNPVWRRPFVAPDNRRLILLLPSLVYSFPFAILEQFILGKPTLEAAYARARADYLEESIESHVRSGMPSAAVYRGVMWRDDETGKEYENDVVAMIGNTIFLFEAKSGKLDDVARRGGDISLMRNFTELFVEPGKQAQRLEQYINSKKSAAKLWLKKNGQTIALDLENPKVVHKFSICIEHFASLTSAKHHLKALGLISNDEAWAPVLSLGELLLIWRHLDTEVSFFHYLTRRATLEELIDFEGDEQDILSMYLVNGLCIDPAKLNNRPIRFMDFDTPVRQAKTPRADRTEFEIFGIPLTGYWKKTLEEIYRDTTMRHRFDIIQVVLNQDPEALAGIEQRARKWKNGLGSKGDVLLSRYVIGKRTFVLAYHLSKNFFDASEWQERSRMIAHNAAGGLFKASDCAVFLRFKKSKEWTYDAFSFHRLMEFDRQA